MQQTKNIVVTGGNKGIGYYTVKGLYEDGHNVIFASRNQNLNKEAAEEIMKNKGGSLKYFPLDLSKRSSIDEFVKNVKVIFQQLRKTLITLIFLSIMLD